MLRDYQEAVITDVYKALRENRKRLLIQAPTGAGKSIILATLTTDFLKQKKKVAIVAHRSKLLNQLEGTLKNFFDQTATYVMAGKKTNYNADIFLCMAQTLTSEKRVMPDVDIILIDEAHISCSFRGTTKLLNHNLGAIWGISDKVVIGLTATPYRMKIREGLCYLFDYIINAPSTRKLIEAGYLTKPVVYTYDSQYFDKESVKMDEATGDYNERDLAKKLTFKFAEDVIEKWRSLDDTHKTILFAASVKQAKFFTERFNELGYKAACLLGDTSQAERQKIYERFENKELQILVNISVLTEGFDSTDIQSVVLARPSESFALVSQMIGRGLRLHPGKDVVNIIDCSGFLIHDRHMQEAIDPETGDPYIIDFFDKMAKSLCPKCKEPGEAPTKQCVNEDCQAVLAAPVRICPHCDTKQPVKLKEPKAFDFPALIQIEGRSLKAMHAEYRFVQKELQKCFIEMRTPAVISDRVFGKFQKFPEDEYYKGAVFGDEVNALTKSAYSYFLAVVSSLDHQFIKRYFALEFGVDEVMVKPLSPSKYMGLPNDPSLITREMVDARYFEMVKDMSYIGGLILNMTYAEILRRCGF